MARQLQLLASEHPIAGIEPLTLGDLWAWGYSDVLANTTRSVFAEFLVGVALGVVDRPRIEWDASDLGYRGLLIEVKSSAYLQSWPQPRLSKIVFDIAKKKSWFAATNEYSRERIRAADVFVFCLLGEKDPQQCNPLDVARWEFYVVTRMTVDARFGDQKSATLTGIRAITNAVRYDQLNVRMDELVNEFG